MLFRKPRKKESSNPVPVKPFNFFGLPSDIQSEVLSYLPIEKLACRPVSKLFQRRVTDNPEYKFINLGEKILNEKKELIPQLIDQINQLILSFNERYPDILQIIDEESEINLSNYHFLSAIHNILANLISQVDEELITTNEMSRQLIDVTRHYEKAITKTNRRFGLQMLGEGLISIEQIFQLNPNCLDYFFSSAGYKALTENIITLKQLERLDDYCIKLLLQPKGIKALNEQLITVEEAGSFNQTLLEIILSKNGINALKCKAITIDILKNMMERISNYCIIELLVTPLGLTALNENFISIDDAAEIDYGILQAILTENGLQVLRTQLMTLQEINEIGFVRINMLFAHTKNCIQILTDGKITVEEIKRLDSRALQEKLNVLDGRDTKPKRQMR